MTVLELLTSQRDTTDGVGRVVEGIQNGKDDAGRKENRIGKT
jgi:hypothetical protein